MLAVGKTLVDYQRRNHTLRAICEVRQPDGGNTDADWHALQVVDGSVTVYPLGQLPNRTCSVTVATTTVDYDSIDSWLTPFGSWIRLAHEVTPPAATPSPVRVPLGWFRVDTVTVNELEGTVLIEGSDAGALVYDYSLPTLAAGRVKANQVLETAARNMLYDSFRPDIPPWWTDYAVPPASTTKSYTKAKQYEGSRVDAVTDLANRFHRKIKCIIDGSHVFEFVVPNDYNDPGDDDVLVYAGLAGNLESQRVVLTRDGIFNVALVRYQADVKSIGAKLRHEERRLVSEYTVADSAYRANGPYGRVTMDVQTDIPAGTAAATADQMAKDAAEAALKQSTLRVRTITVDCSPIYGIEAGDIVKVMIDHDGKFQARGLLTGAVIALMPGTWSLTIDAFIPQWAWRDPTPKPPEIGEVETVDQSEWVTMTALPKASVDMSFDKLTGWSATGATLKDVGRTAELTASGSATTQLASIANFNSKQEGRVRVVFTVHAIKTDVRCRSFINPIGAPGIIYGNWKTVPHNHTLTVSADLQMAINTAFAVGIDIASYPNAGTLPAGVKVNVNQVAVDYARRQKQ